MALQEGEELLYECKSGWLTVEEDFSARLSKPEQLQYGESSSKFLSPCCLATDS